MYHITISGIPILCETPEEALRLARIARRQGWITGNGNQSNQPQESATSSPTPPAKEAPAEIRQERWYIFLKLLEGRPLGRTTEELTNALGIEDPRGLGPVVGALTNALREYDMALADVAGRWRDAAGKRCWKAGTKLSDFLETIEARAL